MNEHFKGLGHIAVHTKDLAGSIAFYEKIGGTLRQKDSVPTPDGEKLLALVEFGGVVLELIQSPIPVPMTEGNIPTSPCMWTMWTKPRRPSAPPAWTPS